MCNGGVTTGCFSIKRGRYQVAAENISLYSETLLLLGAAVVAAPLFKSVGLGTVLGYLTAGIVIGPIARLIVDGEEILQVAELGVVFLLFVIGLELKPARLWALRRDIFGLGLAQVVATGLVLCLLIMFIAGIDWQTSLVIGFGLALSSTAFALQLLAERGDTNRVYGQTSFSILLFQDIAIVPLLALIPLFSLSGGTGNGSPVADFAIALAAIAGLLDCGSLPAQSAVSDHCKHWCPGSDDRGGTSCCHRVRHADAVRRTVHGHGSIHCRRFACRINLPP